MDHLYATYYSFLDSALPWQFALISSRATKSVVAHEESKNYTLFRE